MPRTLEGRYYLEAWRWARYVSAKRWNLPASLQGVKIQNVILTAVRVSNPTPTNFVGMERLRGIVECQVRILGGALAPRNWRFCFPHFLNIWNAVASTSAIVCVKCAGGSVPAVIARSTNAFCVRRILHVCNIVSFCVMRNRCILTKLVPSPLHACPRHGSWAMFIRLSHARAKSEILTL
jgi:hypothetical protein